MRLTCPRCGASWPTDRPPAVCPVCAAVDPNAGGSPSGVEEEDEALLDGADE